MGRRAVTAAIVLAAIAVAFACRHASAAGAPAPDAWIDTDCSRLAAADMRKLPAHERIGGALPGKWQDNSSRAQVWVRYGRMEQQGRAFLRMEITRRVDSGSPRTGGPCSPACPARREGRPADGLGKCAILRSNAAV